MLLGPYCSGSWSHWQPLRNRKMIAFSIFRQLATFRPVGFLGQNSKRIGSIRRHNSSEISQIVPSGLRRGFRRTMAQSPVVVPGSGHCLLQAPSCKRCSAGSRIVTKGFGTVEIGYDPQTGSFIRAIDKGGMAWSGESHYKSLDNAFEHLENGIKATTGTRKRSAKGKVNSKPSKTTKPPDRRKSRLPKDPLSGQIQKLDKQKGLSIYRKKGKIGYLMIIGEQQ